MGPRKRARHDTAVDGSSAFLPEQQQQPQAAKTTTTSLQTTNSTASTASTSTTTPASSLTASTVTPSKPGPAASSPVIASVQEAGQVRRTRSWYGSWPRIPKSSASTPQVAKESIMGGTMKPKTTPDFSRFESKKTSEDPPADSPKVDLPSLTPPGTQIPSGTDASEDMVATEDLQMKDGSGASEADAKPPEDNDHSKASRQSSSGWLGWFGKTPTKQPEMTVESEETLQKEAFKEDVAEPNPEPRQPVEPETVQKPSEQPDPGVAVELTKGSRGSWFPFWSGTPSKPPPEPPTPVETTQPPQTTDDDVPMQDAPPPSPRPESSPSAGSTWAFWSRESKAKSQKGKEPEPGELAVIGDGSENHPQPVRAVDVEPQTPPAKEPAQPKSPTAKKVLPKKTKRTRPQSMELDESAFSTSPAPSVAESSKSKVETPRKTSASKTPAPAKALPPNLLLPSFRSTYQMKENPSILRQITELLLRTKQPPTRHVFRVKEPPNLKRALAIGVHGLFPAAYLRPMIGQPTGTSIKFANHGAEAIRRWAESNGCHGVEIEKVALEGEGKIGDRVDNLWKLLLNWLDHIRNADFILVCCHSQGVPVSVMLVDKLIDLGIITSAKIGICAMAGVSLGPFPDYKSGMGMLMGSAAELWQFSNPESEVSQRHEYALKAALEHGVRITYIGSIDDQLIPMESAVYSPASHPYIYRAVFIDGRIHAPDFIAHLVGFALKLRNLGVSDHGLIRELSVSLAGSLYGGEGHSRLYDDEQVYDLAVSHALETTDVKQVPCHVKKHKGLVNPNPYHLPWIMRGLLEEDFVKTELTSEASELLQQFDDWKPSNKALKDVKYRLEAVRSKL